MYRGNIEITKREILISVIIFLILITIGLSIHSAILQNTLDENEMYHKALKLSSPDEFTYGMKTNIGNAFVEGELVAVKPVSYPDLKDDYLWVCKETEKYTRHTRTVTKTRTVNGKTQTYTDTEVYWSWDRIHYESKESDKVLFNSVKFNTSKIKLPSNEYIKTVREGNIRYIYYGVPKKNKGTIFATLKDNTIFNVKNPKNQVPFYSSNLQDTYDYCISSGTGKLVLFWVLWSIFIILVIIGFFYFENKWLE